MSDTTREQFETMRAEFRMCANRLELQGITRGQIGVAMVGYAMALVQVHVSHDEAMGVLDSVRYAMMQAEATEQ